MEIIQALQYSTPDGTADFTTAAGSLVVPTAVYATIAAIQAVANTIYVPFSGPPERRPLRGLFTMAAVAGADNKTLQEDLYIVTHFQQKISGVLTDAFLLEKLANLVYTFGTTAATGLRASHKFPKSVVLTDTGFSKALGFGQDLITVFPKSGISAVSMAGVVIGDIGPAVGILRCPALGASAPATSGAPMHQLYR